MLEQALRHRLSLRTQVNSSLGELETLALRIGLIQNSMHPRLQDPQLIFFAADHGLAESGLRPTQWSSTAECVRGLLRGELLATVFAQAQGMQWWVTDAGVREPLQPHPRLLARKQFAGSCNASLRAAMTTDQAQAAIRAGMEIGDAVHGNLVACACIGLGAQESAALVLAQLAGVELHSLLGFVDTPLETLEKDPWLGTLQQAQARHCGAREPVEVLAALGGADIAMAVGTMLVAASKRSVIVVDGLPSLAALMVASMINPKVPEFCIFSRSNNHPGLSKALGLFASTALLELGMECIDGTGTALVWPMLLSATAVLSDGPWDEKLND